jgi:hypothetical protein
MNAMVIIIPKRQKPEKNHMQPWSSNRFTSGGKTWYVEELKGFIESNEMVTYIPSGQRRREA